MKTKTIISPLVFVLLLGLSVTGLFAQCSTVSGAYDFYSDITFTGSNTFVYSHYYVHNGVTVTIDAADCSFYTGSVFSVLQGGNLIIQNSTLKAGCPGQLWSGIEIVGDMSGSAFTTVQGYVEVNNSVISDAVVGVKAIGGGIINAHGSTFRNNNTGIKIGDYTEAYPYSIVDCDFEEARYLATVESAHLDLNEVKGLSIEGCFFKGISETETFGVRAINSSFTIMGSGGIIPNSCPLAPYRRVTTFSDLAEAVHCENTDYDIQNASDVSIKMTQFLGNGRSIYSMGNIRHQIESNTFKNWYYWYNPNDISIANSSVPFKIADNTFEYDEIAWGNSSGFAHIAIVEYSYATIDIKRNIFNCINNNIDRRTARPIHIFNHNTTTDHSDAYTYLNVTCNQFTNYINDITITNTTKQSYYLGSPESPANNVFSSTSTKNFISNIQFATVNAQGACKISYAVENPLTDINKQPAGCTNVNVYKASYGATRSCAGCVNETQTLGLNALYNDNQVANATTNWIIAVNIETKNIFTAKLVSQKMKAEANTLELFDVSGKPVYNTPIEDGTQIDLSNFQPGIYLYHIIGEYQTGSGKLQVR